MRKLAITLAFVVASLSFICGSLSAQETKPKIQVAILLDTSGSMDGLIEQAKTRLWDIVNEFVKTTKAGMKPQLQVALYEYGNDRLKSDEGYIRMICPLTDDLDKVSEELFALTTNGGSEYCGQVIKCATEGLAWSKSNGDLKIIFIAGNEPFTQGGVDYRQACKDAIGKGIIVNTIFCGNQEEGARTNWKDGADLADGKYVNIDQNQAIVHIETPQDGELARLNGELNRTYVVYGRAGAEGKARQEAQDLNALNSSGAVAAQRAASKASAFYSNERWDLVDAVNNSHVKLDEVQKEELPEEMKKMSDKEREDYVKTKTEERKKIQAQITKLAEERKAFIAEKRREAAGKDGKATLDQAIILAVREQAAKRDFQVK
ncbi:MAG TPA: VWA domain-containing protein [Candidatus Brocadiia bacterium]|nr:VWA domain-containing protein [Candidatus Brocadiia bacterium]